MLLLPPACHLPPSFIPFCVFPAVSCVWGLPTHLGLGQLSALTLPQALWASDSQACMRSVQAGLGPALTVLSPHQSPDFVEELRSLEPSPSPGELTAVWGEGPGTQSSGYLWFTAFPPSLPGPQDEDGEVALVLLGGRPSPGAVGPEDMALCSSRRAVRPGRRGLGPVPS